MKDNVKSYYPWLFLIVSLGLIFRTYNFAKSFSFAHDQDLYSWIAKDIIINHHHRLIGQVTSINGVFIGSFYYYLMALFYQLGRMNPLSAFFPLTLVGLFNIISVFIISKRHFGLKTGLIMGTIWSTAYGITAYERWSVPTQLSYTWSIWFLGTALEIIRGNYKFLILAGFLLGFIWQIHIALAPLTVLILLSILGRKAKRPEKWFCLSLVVFLLSSLPLIAFEVKSNFSQARSFWKESKIRTGGPSGWQKAIKVIGASSKEIQTRFMFGSEIKQTEVLSGVLWLMIVLALIAVWQRGLIDKSVLRWLSVWIILALASQYFSPRIISEYYFANLIPVVALIISLALSLLPKNFVILVLCLFVLVNIKWLREKSDDDQSFFYREKLIDYIKKDVDKKNYPCVAFNYIADPGVGVGFRYLAWYRGISLVKSGSKNMAIYNIFIPWQLGLNESVVHFGRFGVKVPMMEKNILKPNDCLKKENQLDPLLGYTD